MKYLRKHVFVPFISEETDSPIGVCQLPRVKTRGLQVE